MEDGTWIQIALDFLLTQWVWVLIGLAVMAMLIAKAVKSIKEKKQVKKKLKEKEAQIDIQSPAKPVLQQTQRVGVTDDFSHIFYDKKISNSAENSFFRSTASVVDLMESESKILDKALENDFETLKNELRDVHDKRERIREYGKRLGELFQRYSIRENQITIQLANIEEFVNKK